MGNESPISLQEQTEAPECYTSSFQVETGNQLISFHMDAQVFVPEASLAPVLELEHDPYTEKNIRIFWRFWIRNWKFP